MIELPFTVNNLLELAVLSGAKIIAGEDGLQRVIKSISFIEAPDSINWIMPYDLILTNAFLLYTNPEIKNNFIDILCGRNASAIGIKLDRYIQNLPEEMLKQANVKSFPIIILPYKATPSKLISAIGKIIYANDYAQKKTIENNHYKKLHNFFSELLFSKDLSSSVLLRKASALGWDFNKSFCIMVIDLADLSHAKKVISIINQSTFNQAFFVFQYQQEIIIVKEANNMSEKEELEEYGRKIEVKCQVEIPGLKITIGIGRPYKNPFDLTKSHFEARNAIRLGQLSCENKSVFLFENLGIYKILCQVNRMEELEYYTKDNVLKLKQYDLENNSEYFKTMEAFIKFNGNINETAKYLCVHYNTVKYRLNVIRKILNLNIEDPDIRLDFLIGIKIVNLLELKS